jgi:molybdopterin-guanine dinucleotide biosynthesis protein A
MYFRYVSRFLSLLKSAGGGSMMGTVKRKMTCGGKAMTAVVLAGGRGRRMKADKARLAVGGRTLLEHVVAQLKGHFDEILVSVSPGQTVHLRGRPIKNKGDGSKREAASHGPTPRIVEDEVPDLGPLGGILAGLKAAANDACMVVACDIPDIDLPLLRSLVRAVGEKDIAVPAGPAGHYEPLFAVYRKCTVPEVEALLQAGERSIIPLFERCRTAVVRLEDDGRLRNLNTRADYREYLESFRSKRLG